MRTKTPSLTDQYSHKIKSVEDLCRILGPHPRKRKADILVASLTADAHISKGHYRPHIPQDLRALNLAAYEIVDYVIIDTNATPIKNISKLRPDFFAKGYEYTTDGLPAKTQEEADALHAYGGEIIFTPGDIVYSSSKLIDLAPPTIKIEKLLTFMESEKLTFNSLRDCLDRLKNK